MNRSLGCGCNAGTAGLGGVMDSVGVPVLLFVGLFGAAGLVAYSMLKNKMRGA